MTKHGKLYFGWKVVFCSFLCLFFGQIFYTNCAGIYTKAITEQFGFARAEFSLYMTVASVVMLVLSPVLGRLYQNKRPRNVLCATLVIQTIGYLGFTFCTQLWQFYLLAVCLGIGFAGVVRLAPSVLVNLWFGPKLKGRAMAITTTSVSFGAVLIIPLVTQVVGLYGWKSGYYLTAAVNLLVMLPIFWFLVKTPDEVGVEKQGLFSPGEVTRDRIEDDGQDMTPKQMLRTPEFYIFSVGLILLLICATGMLTNVQMYFNDIGMSPAMSAWLYSASYAFAIGGKFLLGWTTRKFGLKFTAAFAAGWYALGMVGLFLTQYNYYCSGFYLVGYAIGSAITIFLIPILSPTLWGVKYNPQNYSVLNTVAAIGGIIGTPAVALVYDLSGSYAMAWIVLAVLFVLVGICFVASLVVSERRKAKAKPAA